MSIKINNINVIDDSRNINAAGIATVGSGSSSITIDGTSGVVNVGSGVTLEGTSGDITISGTLTAGGIDIPANVITFDPLNNDTDVNRSTDITFTFDQIVGIGTTGYITLRSGSADGVGIETFSALSLVPVTGYQIRVPRGTPGNTGVGQTIFPVVDPTAIVSTGGFAGINTGSGPSYKFTLSSLDLNSITPANSSTGIALTTNITLAFNGALTRGTGTIELRSGSVSGTLVESFDAATSNRISIAGTEWILDPTNSLDFSTSYYLIIPPTGIQNFVGLNTTGTADSYEFTSRAVQPGDPYEGGYLISISGSTGWIVAPQSAEVSRTIGGRNDANTVANAVTGCTGWFVPTQGQLSNPGYACRDNWDSYSPTTYWSSSTFNSNVAFFVNFATGATGPTTPYFDSNNSSRCVRSFRCITI